jgi:hypothetical protein
MRLTEQDPKFLRSTGEDRFTHLDFRCPCAPTCTERICVPFTPAIDGTDTPPAWKPWQRSGGNTFELITLSPSIWFHGEDIPGSSCKGWHGFLRAGNLETC